MPLFASQWDNGASLAPGSARQMQQITLEHAATPFAQSISLVYVGG
jgi:hypothetical protein